MDGDSSDTRFLRSPIIVWVFGFAYGLLFGWASSLPGQLRAGEFLSILIVPFAFRNNFKNCDVVWKSTKTIFALLVIVAIWQTGLDTLVHDQRFDRTVDYVGTVAFCAVNLIGMTSLLLRYTQVMLPLLFGIAIGEFLFASEIIVGANILENEYWDLRVARWGGPLLLAFLIVASRLPMLVLTFIACSYAVIAIYYGARSHGLSILLGAIAPLLLHVFPNRIRRALVEKPLRSVLLGIPVVYLIAVGYVYAAQEGFATEKGRIQLGTVKNPFNPLELIRSGRKGALVGIEAILKRPFEGYGSMQYSNCYTERTASYTYYNYIHSVVIEAGVYGGVVGLAIWMCIVAKIITCQPQKLQKDAVSYNGIECVGYIAMFLCFWSLFFSPFVSVRFIVPPLIAVQFTCLPKRALSAEDSEVIASENCDER